MTDDLVKRLRCDTHWPLDWDDAISWCREAADRIEQLEAALQWIVDCEPVAFRQADYHGENCNCRRCAMDNARKALEGKDD